MELNAFTQYTNTLLKNLSKDSVNFSLNPAIIRDISRISNNTSYNPRMKENEFDAVSGSNFRIPLSVSSIPYITDINEGEKIKIKTIEPASYKLSTNSRLSNSIVGINTTKFRDTLPALNRLAFSKGLNLDSYRLLNISNAPLSKEILKGLLSYGAIVPLNSTNGVFIPNFALQNATYNSIEYEGRFIPYDAATGKGLKSSNFKSMITDPIKEDFGLTVDHLFTHTAQNSLSYALHYDSTIASRQGRFAREVVLGAAPLSNLITATNIIFSSWHKREAIAPTDRVMDFKAGMHVSTTVSSLTNDAANSKLSNYINHAGIILGALSRTSTRWGSHSYLGVSNKYEDDRKDFRTEYNKQRLEMRYPGTVFDIGYVTDQLIMANKITSDVENYLKEGAFQESHHIIREYQSGLSGSKTRALSIMKGLHNRNHPEHTALNTWFNSFMDHIGITDEFSKSFIKNINSRCLKVG